MKRALMAVPLLTAGLACGSATAAEDMLSETWKEASIETAYTLNEHLNPFAIDVEVNGNTALLQGTVESDVDRDLARQIALATDGIDQVDSQLVVDPDTAADGTGTPAFARTVNDASLTARVKSQLLWNQEVSGLDVEVSTEDGVVSLRGTVESDAERALVERIARNTDGVRRVKSSLRLGEADSMGEDARQAASRAGRAVSDAWISAKVGSALLFNRNVDAGGIEVDTSGGVVTLSGTVDNEAERRAAVEVAGSIVGVKRVRTAFGGS